MKIPSVLVAAALVASPANAQQPPRQQQEQEQLQRLLQRPPRPGVMALTTTAWKDGGVIPTKNAQPGRDVSPALSWSRVPDGAESFVLMARDLDAVTDAGDDQFLHWLVWNIPKTARGLTENQPREGDLADGSHQISGSGPYYRGPAASIFEPPHHYVFELYALNAKLDLKTEGSPEDVHQAVQKAMAGKILAKGVLTGLFRRN